MEHQNPDIIVNQKVARAWRGYGFFIAFYFGKIRPVLYKSDTERKIIELDQPNISLNIEATWGIIKDDKEVISLDSTNDLQALYQEIDTFLEVNFPPNQVSIEKVEIQELVTVFFFSNGYELEVNNEENEREGWFILTRDGKIQDQVGQ